MNRVYPRIMGISKAIISVLWMILGVLGLIYGLKGIQLVKVQLDLSLTTINMNIQVVRDILVEISEVVDKTEKSLGSVERSSFDAGLGMNDTRPLIKKTSSVVTSEIPEALDEVQASMPSVIEAAAAIDHTLTLLSNFRFSIPNPFGTNWELSLGVTYNPPIPLEEALANLGGNLEGIPVSMRAIESDLVATDTNFLVMSEDLLDMAHDLDLLREQIADLSPNIERMNTNLSLIQESVDASQARIFGQFDIFQKIFILVMILFILSQIPSIFFGYSQAKQSIKNEAVEKGG